MNSWLVPSNHDTLLEVLQQSAVTTFKGVSDFNIDTFDTKESTEDKPRYYVICSTTQGST